MATINDIVLIHYENTPLSFARIESIEPDVKRDWYHVTLLLLQMPMQTVTWILRNAYINGETFTMDGKQVHLELIENKQNDEKEKEQDAASNSSSDGAKVISLTDLKKK
ncbi:MAG: hypothetical protein GY874_01080 [Desulfobacteraceae bacterium]|nr:hypothetical protein [Desulfobacteraceae bacterium]